MAEGRRDWITVMTWVLIASALGMVAGFGLCGLSLVHPRDQGAQQDVASIGAAVFFGSLGLFLLSALVMIILGIVRAVRK